MDQRDRLLRELEQIRREVAAETERHIMALANLRVREARTELALQQSTHVGTISPMQEQSRGAAISAAKTWSEAPFQAHLRKRRLSIPEWHARLGKSAPSVNTVRSWVKQPGHGGRSVPREWAERLAEEFGDPSLLLAASWPNGIRNR